MPPLVHLCVDVERLLCVIHYSFIALMIEDVITSETSVTFYNTALCNIPEYTLHIRRRENLKSHKLCSFLVYAAWHINTLLMEMGIF
jgi:hypothetical protein